MRSSPRTTQLAMTSTITAFLVLVISLLTGTGNAFASSRASSAVQQTASSTVAPANTAVTTYKEDTARTGNHATETILTTSNVKQSTFGKRVTYAVDGQIYAQPLFLPNVTVKGASHNVVYVATEHDSIYAFDADATKTEAPLWHTSFINAPRVVSPSNTDVTCQDMVPENGLSGTPVIDRNTGTLYAVVLTKENSTFVYRLHALDIATGREKAGSPIIIQASVAGKGAGSVNGRVTFLPLRERQRASPLLANGKVYIAWGSFCDNDPYHGWIMSYSYNGSHLQQVNVYNDTANSSRGGIWGAGGAMSADNNGDIYYVSGNGGFDANTGGIDYGDSFVKLNARLQVQDYFAPFNQQCLNAEDADLGSGGPLLLPGQNRIIGAGKEGRIYVINTANMGRYNTIANPCSNQSRTNVDHVVQELPPATIGGLFSNATYWKSASGQQYVYFAGAQDHTKAFTLTNGTLSTRPSSSTSEKFGFTGGNPTISSNNGAKGTGILWTVDPTPALRAYDATNLGNELYNSAQNSARDGLDSYVKFAAPTVANGEVFVGTKSSLHIFGLITQTTPAPNGYNNVGITDDGSVGSGNYDGVHNSYSAQALQSIGLNAGDNAFDPTRTVVFTWPNVQAGTQDNYQATGQVIPVTPASGATILAFLGSATNGPSSGTATITYTDSSTQTFTLGFSDWTLNAGTSQPAYGNEISYTASYRNNAHLANGKETIQTYVFYSSVNLEAGKQVASVTLPTTVTSGQIHVFAVTTK